MRQTKRLLVIAACIFALPWLAWKGFIYRHHLRLVPEALNVWSVEYVSEEVWGFGPGGNETGIIVYGMPTKVREALTGQNSLTWLQSLPPNSWQGWQGKYAEWHATPPGGTSFWDDLNACSSPESIMGAPCPGIAGYLGRYGFNIQVDQQIEAMVNNAVLSPGAYYAFGRVGILILIPAQERIVYVYSG